MCTYTLTITRTHAHTNTRTRSELKKHIFFHYSIALFPLILRFRFLSLCLIFSHFFYNVQRVASNFRCEYRIFTATCTVAKGLCEKITD